MVKILKFFGAVILCQMAGMVGSLFTAPKISGWYASLKKPVFAPPSPLFAPVWIALFFLMGISLFLIMEKTFKGQKLPAFIAFGVQLVLNVLWSALFFGAQAPAYAFFEILLLWVAILATLVLFFRISKLAGLLFLPYLLW